MNYAELGNRLTLVRHFVTIFNLCLILFFEHIAIIYPSIINRLAFEPMRCNINVRVKRQNEVP